MNPTVNAVVNSTVDLSTAEFVYRIPGNTKSARPGAHRSNSRGAGMNFISHARLFDQPDPRRLDLRASINDIHKDWLVRINKQRASVTVSVIVDVSTSMHFSSAVINKPSIHGGTRGLTKLQVVAEFLHALGFSAAGLGDSVSFEAFDSRRRSELAMPARFGRAVGLTMADLVASCKAESSADINALSECIESIAGQSSLVFIASDFHWPLDRIDRILSPLAGAMIVPFVVWDKAEITPPENNGLLSVRQMGGKGTRHLWMTPAVRKEWHINVERRRREITKVFSSQNAKPFWVNNGFNAESLSRYFMEAYA